MILLKSDEEHIQHMQDMLDNLESSISSKTVKSLNFKTVKTENIEAIIGREELLTLFLFSDESVNDYYFISVTEPFQKKSEKSLDILSQEQFQTPKKISHLLQLEFTDMRKKHLPLIEKYSDKIKLIDLVDKEKIKSFILEAKENNKKLIINCDAGISRSSAIGVFIERMIGTKEGEESIREHYRYLPNEFILQELEK